MTNWLDPAEVRAAYQKAESTKGKWSTAATQDYHRSNAWRVLEAIAALPEPESSCGVRARQLPDGTTLVDSVDVNSLLHRIWRIARIVCGKD